MSDHALKLTKWYIKKWKGDINDSIAAENLEEMQK